MPKDWLNKERILLKNLKKCTLGLARFKKLIKRLECKRAKSISLHNGEIGIAMNKSSVRAWSGKVKSTKS